MEKLITQLTKPKPYSTLYIDMDSFFASVEQFYNPKLRGKPVGVATGTTIGASIVAASIEAKRMGVRGGVKVENARRMCPGIVVVSDSPHSYRAIHRQIMAVLQATPCMVEAKSIDEAVLRIPHYMQNSNDIFALIKAIKANLYKMYNEHIYCSIGVSSNMWLAKMAASYKKPNGVYIVHNKLEEFYTDHSLLDLTGINYRMRRRLYAIGILSPFDLYCASRLFLRRSLGVEGEKWYFRMRGYEVDKRPLVKQRSLSHQVTTIPDYPDNLDKITTYLLKISDVLGRRLRDKHLKARSVYLNIRLESNNYQMSEFKNVTEFNDSLVLSNYLKMLLKKLEIKERVIKITVGVGKVSESWQLDFDTYLHQKKANTMYAAIDKISQKYNKAELVRSLGLNNSDFIDLERVGFAGDIIRETSDLANY